MTAFVDHFQLRATDRVAVRLAVGEWHEAVLLTPNHQRRRLHAAQPMTQLGIMHVRLPAKPLRHDLAVLGQLDLLRRGLERKELLAFGDLVDVVEDHRTKFLRRHQKNIRDLRPFDVEPDRIDQDQLRYSLRTGRRQLGRDPSAHRKTDNRHALHVEAIEKVHVEVDHVSHAVEPRRLARTAKSRMRGKVKLMMLSQRVVTMQPAHVSSCAMQHQEWAALAASDQMSLRATQFDKFFTKIRHECLFSYSRITYR